jgi:hypothetical protein
VAGRILMGRHFVIARETHWLDSVGFTWIGGGEKALGIANDDLRVTNRCRERATKGPALWPRLSGSKFPASSFIVMRSAFSWLRWRTARHLNR